jgi:hypothetical protein
MSTGACPWISLNLDSFVVLNSYLSLNCEDNTWSFAHSRKSVGCMLTIGR